MKSNEYGYFNTVFKCASHYATTATKVKHRIHHNTPQGVQLDQFSDTSGTNSGGFF